MAAADGKAVAILHSESVMKSLPNPPKPTRRPRYHEGGEVDTKSLSGDDETKIRPPTLQNNNQTMEIRFRLATIKLWRGWGEGGRM